jgi:orotate phosphoribosyltransferase
VPLRLAAPGADGRASAITTSDDLNGQRVLLVNDVVTTGAGMQALTRFVEAAGGDNGAAWFASRSRVDVEDMIGVSALYVVALELSTGEVVECELCRRRSRSSASSLRTSRPGQNGASGGRA